MWLLCDSGENEEIACQARDAHAQPRLLPGWLAGWPVGRGLTQLFLPCPQNPPRGRELPAADTWQRFQGFPQLPG